MSRNPDRMIERRSRILDILKNNGYAMVTELAESFHTTEVTIRSDLAALEKEGSLVRMAGGAVLPQEDHVGNVARAFLNAPEKYAIAQCAAMEIQNGDTLFINAGSTTLCFAEALKSFSGLKIVTNSIPVANALGGLPGIHVILIGGEVNGEDGFTYGTDALETLSRYQAKFSVLSLDGISAEGGVSTIHAEEAEVLRAMLSHSERCLLLADYSKLGKKGFLRFTGADGGKTLITDEQADLAEIRKLQNTGMKVLRAKM